jgi:hypothetical protein
MSDLASDAEGSGQVRFPSCLLSLRTHLLMLRRLAGDRRLAIGVFPHGACGRLPNRVLVQSARLELALIEERRHRRK